MAHDTLGPDRTLAVTAVSPSLPLELTKALARLSVRENMMLAAPRQSGERFLPALRRSSWSRQEGEIETKADTLLERFRLTQVRDAFAGTLSGGQRKLLELARALMVEPTVLMLDEPVAGVNPSLTQSILGTSPSSAPKA